MDGSPRWLNGATALILLISMQGPLAADELQGQGNGGPPPAELAPFLTPLLGTEPGGGRTDDLEFVASWLGEIPVVGLGESEHGARDFHRLGHRIFQHLARQEGFGVFAWEISQAHAARLNDYVHARRDDLATLVAERWWTAEHFYNQAFVDLLRWMRTYNQTAERPVSIAGYDFKQPSFAMEAVVEQLERLDPDAATHARTLYETASAIGGLGVFPNVYGYTGSLRVPLPPGEEGRTLRVAVQVRATGVSYGWVGLKVEGSPGDGPAPGQSRFLSSDDLGVAWTTTELILELPPEVDEIEVAVFHRGNGTVWFRALSVDIDEQPVHVPGGLTSAHPRPLGLPGLQVMDYVAQAEPEASSDGAPALRVQCDPQSDEALAAVREVGVLLEQKLLEGSVLDTDATWVRQMSRLVVQSFEWRTLVENNRDIFMAENVLWLHREAFPGRRVLATGHSSHTNRIRRKMGGILADRLDGAYVTIDMLALSGTLRYFPDIYPSEGRPSLVLRELSLEWVAPIAPKLVELGSGATLFDVAGAARKPLGAEWLSSIAPALADQTDVAIVLEKVGPILLP